MNSPVLFIPAAMGLMLAFIGLVCATVAARVLRKRKLAAALKAAENEPPLLPDGSSAITAAPRRRMLWLRCLLAAGLVMLLSGWLGLWATGFSVGWARKPVPQWSDGRAPELEAIIRKNCLPFVINGKSVGLVVGVVTPTNATLMAFGHSSLLSGQTTRADTLFEIGSITKTFTALALAREVERGTVRLNQPIQELLPLGVELPPLARAVTLQQLTTHTSGFPRVPGNMPMLSAGMKMALFGSDPYAGYTEANLLEEARAVKLDSGPGTRVLYSNFGVTLLNELRGN